MRAQHISWGQVFTLRSETLRFLSTTSTACISAPLPISHSSDISYLNRQRSTFTPFKKGDWVWLDSRNLKTIYHKKMKPKQEGPFVITKVLGPVTYRLKLPTSWQIHNVFHATLLKPYRENEIYGENFTEPSPELVEGEEVYEVETIHGHRKQGWGYINITSNGRVILFPTPHGNWNMHFPMMAKYWLTTKNATTFNFSFVSI